MILRSLHGEGHSRCEQSEILFKRRHNSRARLAEQQASRTSDDGGHRRAGAAPLAGLDPALEHGARLALPRGQVRRDAARHQRLLKLSIYIRRFTSQSNILLRLQAMIVTFCCWVRLVQQISLQA